MNASFSRRQILTALGIGLLPFLSFPAFAGKSTKYTGKGSHGGDHQVVLAEVSVTTSDRMTTIKIDIDVLGITQPIGFETFLLDPDPSNPFGYNGIPLGQPKTNSKAKHYTITRRFSEPVLPDDVIRIVFDDIDEDDIILDIPLTPK